MPVGHALRVFRGHVCFLESICLLEHRGQVHRGAGCDGVARLWKQSTHSSGKSRPAGCFPSVHVFFLARDLMLVCATFLALLSRFVVRRCGRDQTS